MIATRKRLRLKPKLRIPVAAELPLRPEPQPESYIYASEPEPLPEWVELVRGICFSVSVPLALVLVVSLIGLFTRSGESSAPKPASITVPRS